MNMSDKVHGNKGRKLSEETKRKISETKNGRKQSVVMARKTSKWVTQTYKHLHRKSKINTHRLSFELKESLA